MHYLLDRPVRLDTPYFPGVSDSFIERSTSILPIVLDVYHGKDPGPMMVSQSLTIQFLGASKVYVSLVVFGPSEANAHPPVVVTDCGW